MSSFDVAQNDGYSRERFYTHSTDKHGHKTTVRASVPPELLRQISKIVASGVIPEYGTAGDFVRDAVFHRLHEIGEKLNDGDILRDVTLQARLDDLIAYTNCETVELELADMLDNRLRESRMAFDREYVAECWETARTMKGREALQRVHNRFF